MDVQNSIHKGVQHMAYEYNHYYELKNAATGQFVNLSGNHASDAVRNGEIVNLFAHTDDPDQRWALERYDSNGGVRIVVQRGEGWYAMNHHTNNESCIVWHLNSADDCDTVICPIPAENESEYYLMLRDRDLYLAASSTTLKWLNYVRDAEQRFPILEPQGSGDSESDEIPLVADSSPVNQFIPAYESNEMLWCGKFFQNVLIFILNQTTSDETALRYGFSVRQSEQIVLL